MDPSNLAWIRRKKGGRVEEEGKVEERRDKKTQDLPTGGD